MRRRIRRAFVVLVVAVSAAWQPAQAADSPFGRRIAVLIGVTEYGPGDNLANPGRDATRMGETLARLGYDVRVLVNPTQAKVESTVATLESQVKAESVPLESLLFFFSGHGGQQNGVSQLILGDADAEGEYRTLDLAALSTRLGALKAAATVFVLDACREDDAELIRGGKTGLAPPPRATGAFFAYAAAPGDLAYDDAGWEDRELSPFTYALIDELLVPGQDIGIIMRKVRDRVSRDTQGQQIPWTEDALTGPLVLNAAPVTPALFDLYGKALKGDALAARGLGYAYLYGEGVDTDVERGLELLRQSAGLGDSQAMLALGAFEAERDRNALQPGHAARDWYLKAGDAGSAEAWYRLAELDMAKLADGQRPGSQVFAWYRRAMSAGHGPAAARYLDLNLQFAMDAQLDRAATLKQLRERSTQGNVAAMVVLGRVYADPQLAEHDDREATFWFERAAGAGNVDALLEQARMAGEGRGEPADLVKAHALTRQAAERGSPRGMLLLARQLQQGRGVAADPAAALIWFRRAAAAGETEALSDLGHAAENGVGRDRDRDEAVALYRRAAALGDPIGTRHLAVVFEHGVGVRRNVDRAIALYRRAAGQGDARAQASLAVLANSGLLTSFPDPVQGAAGLTKVLDTARDGDYAFKLAQMVEKGIGVPADPARAVRLYRRAANEGSAAAASELAAMYKLGSGVEQDVPRAVGLWQQAALAGDAAASYNLAVSYAERNDGPQDLAEAARWARRSAESGNAEAMTLHARHRYLGTPGQAADGDAAFDWLTRALEARNGWAAGTLVALATGQGDLPTTPEVRERALFVLVDALERARNALAAQALRQVYEANTGPSGQRATLAMLQARLDGPERGRALLLLGGAVAEGRLGEAPDPVRAAQHYRDAIAAGEPLAHRFLGDLIADGKLPGVPIEQAIDAYRAGEQAGDAAAANNLGVAYLDGVGGKPDRDAAFESFRMAAENGLPGGMYNLAVAYQRGYGVRTSLEQAEQWYERAVARGHVAARLGLVSVLLNEQPESRDYSRAFWHLADLGRQGSPQAVQALGEVVRNGKLSSGVRGRALAIVTRLAQQENVDVAASLLDDLMQRRDIWRTPEGGYRVAASRRT